MWMLLLNRMTQNGLRPSVTIEVQYHPENDCVVRSLSHLKLSKIISRFSPHIAPRQRKEESNSLF